MKNVFMFFCLTVLIAVQPVYGEIYSKQHKQHLYRKHYNKLINKWKKEPDAAKRKAIEEKIEQFKKKHTDLFK